MAEPRLVLPLPLRFDLKDAERAADLWGCNCGPAALAAMTGLTLEEVRTLIPDFETKRYTNPTMMSGALLRLHLHGARWRQQRGFADVLDFPKYGLARIQWEGPWMEPAVPIRARYRYTHWVGAMRRGPAPADVGVWDVNCVNNGAGWVSLHEWKSVLVPWLLSEAVPRANGRWHITHAIELPTAEVPHA